MNIIIALFILFLGGILGGITGIIVQRQFKLNQSYSIPLGGLFGFYYGYLIGHFILPCLGLS